MVESWALEYPGKLRTEVLNRSARDELALSDKQRTNFRAYREAAGRGDAEAQFQLGFMYDTGLGAPEDDRQAAFWYQKAADQGHADAQHSLGDMYAEGQGVPMDYNKSVTWLKRAAAQGHVKSQFNLGLIYFHGDDLLNDERPGQEVANWLRQIRYFRASRVLRAAKDKFQAAVWIEKAAEQGHTEAQAMLGDMYANGVGVPKSYDRASFWYRRASERKVRSRVTSEED